ncbi:hypothetical protein LOTGIDRAFT_232043 [Lottia gigantea]|uniref:V-SNARE coiled-coil homology domain-containing protein n=1 Tax=Lottia gigantea TaxID=225164 RepID=V4AES3_LOTGI|nr:hypothetical protein LOTGIDRAFT_232043 [Lottia gigantea]ESO95347.1 hypothetical protein LOTGIDRAFT_232043 [Lottia gigantea]
MLVLIRSATLWAEERSRYSSRGKIGHLETEVSEVTSLLRDNVEKVVERGDKINDLQDRTDDLSSSSIGFRKASTKLKRKACWQNCKMTCILILVIAAIIAVIVIVVVVEHPWKSSDKKNNSTLSITAAANGS